MKLKNTPSSYGLIAKSFHWIMALIILGLLSVGFYMAEMEVGPDKFRLYWWHKSFGILILFLALARFAWRRANVKLDAIDTHKLWERALAHFTHYTLYGVLIVMPLTGWLMSSAGDFPAGFFGLFELPHVTTKNEGLFRFFRNAHEILAYIILMLVGLHVAGALKHHFIDRDSTLQRMTLPRLNLTGGILLVLLVSPLLASALLLAALNLQNDENIPPAQNTITTSIEAAPQKIYAAPEWIIRKDQSRINFEATQYGQVFSGAFQIATGEIFFDPDNLADNHVTVNIDITSLDTGSDDRDTQAKSAAWFDTAQFPVAEFTADRFEKTGEDQYTATGTLTIRGVSHSLTLPFSLNIENDIARMSSTLTLHRLDFGIGDGQWRKTDIIGDAVQTTITLTAVRAP